MRFSGIGIVAAALSADIRSTPGAARAAGFSGVLFDVREQKDELIRLSESGRREFKRMLSSQGQRLIGLRCGAGAEGLAGAEADRILWGAEKVFEAAAGMQAELVCMDLGRLPEVAKDEEPTRKITPEEAGIILLPDPTPAVKTVERPAAPVDPTVVDRCDAAMVELGRMADRYGVMVALRSSLSSFTALRRAMGAAACPWFG